VEEKVFHLLTPSADTHLASHVCSPTPCVLKWRCSDGHHENKAHTNTHTRPQATETPFASPYHLVTRSPCLSRGLRPTPYPNLGRNADAASLADSPGQREPNCRANHRSAGRRRDQHRCPRIVNARNERDAGNRARCDLRFAIANRSEEWLAQAGTC